MALNLQTCETLLERYGINAPVRDERFAAHADLQRGIQIDLRCELDPVWGKRVVLAVDRLELSRPCPIRDRDAEFLVDGLRQAGLLPGRTQEINTLKHLLERASALYAGESLKSVNFTIYLRENGYRVEGVRMEHNGSVHAAPRLEPDAHDKGAVFAYRPTTRQRHAAKKRFDR